MSTALWVLVAGNAALMVWLWVHGGNVSDDLTTGELLTSLARITGLLGAYSALLQVLLLARLPPVERLFGFDRLTVWHRWNGHACLDLILAHVVLSVWGYALMDKISLPNEVRTMLGGGVYPGMITATVGTALLIAVVVTSVVIVRRRLRYEAWYAVHLLAYAGIALAWFHQIPTGNELVLDRVAADYWRALYPRHVRSPRRVSARWPGSECAAVPPTRGRGGCRGPGHRLAANHRPRPPPARREPRPVFPVALPRPETLVGLAPLLALGSA